MMSENLYFNIIIYILLIIISSLAAGWSYFEKNSLILSLIFVVAIIIEAILLVKYLNKTNRRLAYFVNSIKNEDTSVKFPKDIKNKAVFDLYNSLNILNDIIRKTKIEIGYNEQLLKTLIEYSSTGFITIDENGDFEVLNHHARKFLGVEHTSNLYRLKQKDNTFHHILTTIRPGETRTHKVKQNEEIFELAVSVSEIAYHDKKYKVVSLQDISKELEEQELESWHKLFRVITHEIMNSIAPLTSLSNKLIQLYSDDGDKKSPKQINEKVIEDTIKGLKVIDDMGNGLMNFVQNYRQLNKVPKPKIEKIELKPWLTNLKTIINEMLKGKDIDFNIILSNDCKIIYADEKLLNQVLLNLITNSIEAMEGVRQKSIIIHVHLSASGKTVLGISDNGNGIPEEDMERAFVPFFTTKENGNGIGLSLSKQIIKMHGGNITLQSKINEGTKAVITF